jgi:DNA-binding transcriptional LysR family regulator
VIELRHLHAFFAVAEELHFGNAAKRLRVAQPAISRDVSALEHAVGLKLFTRSTRNVELTDAGRRFYTRLSKPLTDLDRAIHLAKQEAKGTAGLLRVSYMDFALDGPMFRVVRQFRASFPNVEIELLDAFTDMQIDWLIEHRVDAGFLIGPLVASPLKSVTVHAERLAVVLSSEHRLAREPAIALEDLANEPFVLGSSQAWRGFRRMIESACSDCGFEPKVVQETGSTEAIFGLVKVGLGVSLYTESRGQIVTPGLVFRPLAGAAPTVETILAWNPDNKAAVLPPFLKIVTAQCSASRPSAFNAFPSKLQTEALGSSSHIRVLEVPNAH